MPLLLCTPYIAENDLCDVFAVIRGLNNFSAIVGLQLVLLYFDTAFTLDLELAKNVHSLFLKIEMVLSDGCRYARWNQSGQRECPLME